MKNKNLKVRKIAGILSLSMILSLFPAGIGTIGVVADGTTTVVEKNEVIWSENFDDGTSDFTLENGMQLTSNGELYYKASSSYTGGPTAKFSLGGISQKLNGKVFVFRHKAKVNNAASYISSNIAFDGSRIPQGEHLFGANAAVASQSMVEPGEWYERCYVYHTMNKVSIYQRKLTENTWTLVKADVNTQSHLAEPYIGFYALNSMTAQNNRFEAWLDDFVIYTGDVVELDMPVVSGNDATVSGTFYMGMPGTNGTESATMLAAVYNKATGTTVFADQYKITQIQMGGAEKKSATFSLPELKNNEEASYFVWDSIENGTPLSKAVGYSTPNKAANDAKPESGQEVGITDATSYNLVNLSGYVGDATAVTASLTSENGTVCALLQAKPNTWGMIDVDMSIDPTLYSSGDYTLRVNYGGDTNICKTIQLACDDVNYQGVNSIESYKAFINTYGSEEEKILVNDSEIATEGYDYFCALAGTEGFTDFDAFRVALQESLKAKSYLESLNNAISGQDWAMVETLVTVEAKRYFNIPDSLFASISNVKDALMRMKGNYGSKEEVLPDLKAAVTAQKEAETVVNKIIWTEDFNDGSTGWTLAAGMEVTEDGVLYYKATGEYSDGGSASYNVGGFLDEIKGKNFTFRFKAKVKNSSSYIGSNIAFDGTRIPQGVHLIGDHTSVESYSKINVDEWYERCYVYQGTSRVSIYQRKLSEDSWTLVKADVDTQTAGFGTIVSFFALNNQAARDTQFEMWLDDLIVYTGDAVSIDTPVVSGNDVTITGSFCLGLPTSNESRSATILAAVYNTDAGSTTYVDQKEFSAIKQGITVSKTANFTMPDLESNEETAYLVWDSIENGTPMSEVMGYKVPNKAAENLKPATGQEVGIVDVVNFNQVNLSGYVGKKSVVTASLTDGQGNVCGILQTAPNDYGMIDVDLNLDPEVYASGDYTLRVNYGGDTNVCKEVHLTCNDVLGESINSPDSYKNFISIYGNDEQKTRVQVSGVAEAGHEYFTILAGEDGIGDLNELRGVLVESLKAKDYLDAINQAVSSRAWSTVHSLVTGEAKEYLQIKTDIFAGVNSPKNAILRMTGNYTSGAEILADLTDSISEQKFAESASSGNGGSVGGGGGGGGGSFMPNYTGGGSGGGAAGGTGGGAPVELVPEKEETEPFVDLKSVSWAEDAILAMQELGIVNGDGDGKFYPDRAVTREEFLKMAIQAAGIETNISAEVPFADVNADAWYYEAVATAYACGIVNGIDDQTFGIGRNITRTDMAVIMKRVMDYLQIEAKPVTAAFVFNDFWEIPEYAKYDIYSLCEANLMNGTGENLFKPLASATRAESAVLIYRIYQYIGKER